jgi:HAD superfamily hydrolase (TIGR01484 family)
MRYFLDLDNTVTESRSKISNEMKFLIRRMTQKGSKFIVISGASQKQMEFQLDGLDVEIMSQNGNINSLWKRLLTKDEKEKILEHISRYGEDKPDLLEDRGAQISYSFVGHHAPLDIKKKYDPEATKRRRILAQYPLPEGIEAKIGGTTCVDYFADGLNKGYNIFKFISLKGWSLHSCVYVGDALFPGGNDETVIGTIPTFPVTDPSGLLRFLTT